MIDERIYINIDTKKIIGNIIQAKKLTHSKILFVAKSNCYGFGIQILQKIVDYIDYIGVATVQEGINIRQLGIKIPILILGYTPISKAIFLSRYDLEQSVYSYDFYQELAQFASSNRLKIKIHIAYNSGMNRLGVSYNELVKLLPQIYENGNFEVVGFYSHLATAESDKEYAYKQIADFELAKKLFDNQEVKPIFHLLNSHGIHNYYEYSYDMVRLGILGYGQGYGYKNPINIYARVVQVADRKAGDCIGYDKGYICSEDCRILTVAIGYADGFSGRFANNGLMMYGGQLLPVVGKICMDYCFVRDDRKDIAVGEYLKVLGDTPLSSQNLAQNVGVSNYEILISIGDRSEKNIF